MDRASKPRDGSEQPIEASYSDRASFSNACARAVRARRDFAICLCSKLQLPIQHNDSCACIRLRGYARGATARRMRCD